MNDRLKAYLQLMRLPALFTAWSNILAAHLIVTAGRIEWGMLVLLLASSSALYLAGMVLNDCFDLPEDSRERPNRPLPSGRVPVPVAWRLGWALLGAGVILAAVTGKQSLIIALLLVVGILGYDGWLKQYAAGSLVMGGCRYLNWLLGMSFLPLEPSLLLLPLPIFIYISSVTFLSGIETQAGRRVPILVCMLGMVATGLSILLLYLPGLLEWRWALLPGALLILLLIRALVGSYRNPEPAVIQNDVRLLLLAVIPLDAVLVMAGGPLWGSLLILVLLVPGRLLSRVIYIT